MNKVGIIGGSGLYEFEGLTDIEELMVVDTPFGQPSDRFVSGKFEGVDVIFLSRHGRGHRVSPSEINYRANMFEMKRLGVDAIISVSACGSLREEIEPMHFVVPDQFIDRTNRGREASFFTNGIVAHVAMAEPISSEVADAVKAAATEAQAILHDKGVYLNMEGPQFSTRAESKLYRSWGVDIIGMTNMVEAKLAMEAEIAYATLAAVTDYDCWHPDHDSVTVEMVIANLTKNVAKAKEILRRALPKVARIQSFKAQSALANAIITDPHKIPEQRKKELEILIGKYIPYS